MDDDAPAAPLDLEDERREGLRWLAFLRWWAATGSMAGALLALAAGWTFVSAPAVVGAVLLLVLANAVLVWRTRRERPVGPNELLLHASVDLMFLTWMLAWSGGAKNPISVAYSFHVVLGALLNGRRGAMFGAAASIGGMAVLWALEEADALPTTALSSPPAALWAIALVMLVVGLGYLALVVAERLFTVNARALAQKKDAEAGLVLLQESLAALKVGLELRGPKGDVRFATPYARTLRDTPQAVEGARTVEQALAAGGRPRHRFAVKEGAQERIVDVLALAPAPDLKAFLFVDRTDELLVERRHVMLERLATLGRALQGVAHELNTPLTTMQTLAKDLQAALQPIAMEPAVRADVDESVALLIEESRRCKGLTQALLSTANEGRPARADAHATALDVAKRAVRLVGGRDVELDEPSLSVPLRVDGDRVLQVVMNLVQNALRATDDVAGDGPRVRVRGEERGDAYAILIQDRGPGLPVEVKERMFEPFVTTRPMGEGTGLGLYTSQMIAGELGGTLVVEDAAEGGVRATLVLPR